MSGSRSRALDLARALAILSMVAYHFSYDGSDIRVDGSGCDCYSHRCRHRPGVHVVGRSQGSPYTHVSIP